MKSENPVEKDIQAYLALRTGALGAKASADEARDARDAYVAGILSGVSMCMNLFAKDNITDVPLRYKRALAMLFTAVTAAMFGEQAPQTALAALMTVRHFGADEDEEVSETHQTGDHGRQDQGHAAPRPDL